MKITLIDDICDFTLIECLKFYIVGMRAIINDGKIIGFESEDENGEKNQRVAYVNKQDRHWGIDK